MQKYFSSFLIKVCVKPNGFSGPYQMVMSILNFMVVRWVGSAVAQW